MVSHLCKDDPLSALRIATTFDPSTAPWTSEEVLVLRIVQVGTELIVDLGKDVAFLKEGWPRSWEGRGSQAGLTFKLTFLSSTIKG